MPLLMPPSCLLNTTAIITSQCILKPHSTMTARWWQGTKQGSLCSSSGPHNLYRDKQGESDRATKCGVLFSKYIQPWMWPLCVAIPSCQSVILALWADANHSDTLWMGWSMPSAGWQKVLHLTNTTPCYCEHAVNYTRSSKGTFYSALWWTASPQTSPAFFLRTSDTAN